MGSGIAQDDPTRLFDADIVVDFDGVASVVALHFVVGDIAELVAVDAAAHADIAVHLVHESGVALSPKVELFGSGAAQDLAEDIAVAQVDEGHTARGVDLSHEQRGELGGTAAGVYPDLVSPAHATGVVDEVMSKHLLSVVVYHTVTSAKYYTPSARECNSVREDFPERRANGREGTRKDGEGVRPQIAARGK